jgi:2-oxoglutarate ferredoxin oxidoreductase subunit delta
MPRSHLSGRVRGEYGESKTNHWKYVREEAVMPRPVFSKEKCKGCELCVDACPKKIIVMSGSFNAKGYLTAGCADESQCVGCTLCARACPDVVIEIYK